MKKIISVSAAFVLLALVLAGCGGKKLPDGMKEEDLETNAKAIITAVNAKEYDVIVSLYSPAGPSAEAWQQQLEPLYEQLGAFKEYKKTTFAVLEDEQLGQLVVVLVETKYENATITWKASFNTQMEIVGLRIGG